MLPPLTATGENTAICGGEAQALADGLSRDAFPALQILYFHGNPDITDVGVVALAEALSKTTQTFLTDFQLHDVGMGDEGIAALASLISWDRLEQLEHFYLSHNHAVTNRGILALAQAMDARGLPLLEHFRLTGLEGAEAALGISTIAHTVIKACPDLQVIECDHAHQDMVRNIYWGWWDEQRKLRCVRCAGDGRLGGDEEGIVEEGTARGYNTRGERLTYIYPTVKKYDVTRKGTTIINTEEPDAQLVGHQERNRG